METFLVQLRIVNLLVNFLASFNLVVDLWYSSNFSLSYHIRALKLIAFKVTEISVVATIHCLERIAIVPFIYDPTFYRPLIMQILEAPVLGSG